MKYYLLLLFVLVTVRGYSQNFSEVQKTPVKTFTVDVDPTCIISSGIAGQVIMCTENSVELIDLNTGKPLKTIAFKKDDFNMQEDSSAFSICRAWVSNDYKYLLVSTLKKFRLYSMDNWSKPLMELTQQVHCAAFSPANNKFYTYENKYFMVGKDYEDTSTVNGYIYSWDIATKKMVKKTSVGLDVTDFYSGNIHVKASNGEDNLYFTTIDFTGDNPIRELVSVNLVSGKSKKVAADLGIGTTGGAGRNPAAFQEYLNGSVLFSALAGDSKSAICQATDINSGNKAGFIQLKQYSGDQIFINCETSHDGKYLFLKYQATGNSEGNKGFVAVYTIEKSGANVILTPYKLFPGSDSDGDYFCLLADNQTLVVISKWQGKELTVWKL